MKKLIMVVVGLFGACAFAGDPVILSSAIRANDPSGATSGSRRVLRGGDWCNLESDAKSDYRTSSPPSGLANYDYCFRLGMTIETE